MVVRWAFKLNNMIEQKEPKGSIDMVVNELLFKQESEPIIKKIKGLQEKHSRLTSEILELQSDKRKLMESVEILSDTIRAVALVREIAAESKMDFIVKTVCTVFNLPIETLKHRSRSRNIVLARQYLYRALKDNTSLSLTEIGKTVNKHHATVMHSLANYEWDYKHYEVYRMQCNSSSVIINKFIQKQSKLY